MQHLPSRFFFLLLFGLANSCQTSPNTDQAAQLVLALDRLTQTVLPLDMLQLKRVDGLLAEIALCQVNSSDLTAAKICHEALGNVFLNESNNPVLARKYYERALDIRKRIYAADLTHIDLLRLYHNLGETYRVENTNLLQALHYYDAADEPTPEAMQRVYFNNMLHRGIVLCTLGERERALEDFQRAYLHFKNFLKSDTDGQGKKISEVLNGHAVCYRAMRRYREALEKAAEGNRMVSAISIDTTDPADVQYQRAETADLLLVTGNIWQDSLLVAQTEAARKTAFDSAIHYTQAANRIYQDGQDNIKKINCAGNLGALYRRGGYFKQAVAVLTASIQFSDNLKIGKESAPLFINLGYVWQKQKNYAEALYNYRVALERLGANRWAGVADLPLLSSLKGEKQPIFTLLSNIAQTWIDSSRSGPDRPATLMKSAATYDSLLAFTDQVRGDLMSDAARLQLAKDAKEWVSSAFEGNMHLYQMTREPSEKDHYLQKAFRISEHGKAFALLGAARLHNATTSLPDALQKEEQRLLADLSAAVDHPEQQAAAERRKRIFFTKLENEESQFYHLKYHSPTVPTDTVRQKLLAPDQALVEYFCLDSALYCILISPAVFRVDSVRISKKQLSELVAKFQPLLEQDNPNVEQQSVFIQYSHDLYRVLLAKLEPHLASVNRLIIVPDVPLNNLSFDALLPRTSAGDIKHQVNAENFLVFRYAISYCFSANLLWEMHRHRVPTGLQHKVAAFVPDPARKQEVQDLAKKGFGDVLDATVTAFWKACTQYAYAHVAAHGQVDENNPGRSCVVFNDSSFLYLNDLYNHKIEQDMVVFSACETAKGRYSEGEGNLSLARGLAYAGVRSFITTQWKIPINGPGEIMPPFYDSLFTSKKTKDVALAEAKRTFLRGEGFRLPSNWAGMVFIGACDMASPEKTRPQWQIWAAIVLILSALGWQAKRRRKPKPIAHT